MRYSTLRRRIEAAIESTKEGMLSVTILRGEEASRFTAERDDRGESYRIGDDISYVVLLKVADDVDR